MNDKILEAVIVKRVLVAEITKSGPQGPPGPPGSSLWGGIGGDISDQTDLWDALESRQMKSHILVGPNGNLGFITDGENDEEQIQAGIDATTFGVVELQGVTFSVSSGFGWDKHGVTLKGQGTEATKIVATTNTFDIITVGDRQNTGIMRNFNRIEDLTVTMAGGPSDKACIKIDGGGRGTVVKNVQTNEGAHGFQLIDLDRCFFENIDVNNVREVGIYLQVGLENTYGTVTFINPSVALSDNDTTCIEFGHTAGQTSPNKFDRIAIVNGLSFATPGLTGTTGLKFTVGVTAMSVISSLFESTMNHVHMLDEAQVSFIGDSFMQNSGTSDNAFLLENDNHMVTVQDCRFQAVDNVFNGASGFSRITLLGRNNNQGNITNIFTGQFGVRQGTDTAFAGNGGLMLGTDNERFEWAMLNQIRINNGAAAGRFLKSDASGVGAWNAIAQADVTNLVSDLALKSNDADVVKLAGTQTISGAKTFTTSLTLQSTSFTPLILSRFSTDANAQGFRYIKARGTTGTPAGVETGDQIARFMAAGYINDGTLPAAAGSEDFITINATENWTSAARGRTLDIRTVATGSNTGASRIFIDGAGNVGLGITTNVNSRLTLAASTTASGGILFGSDTNLYRSAADMLKTDDSLHIAGTLGVGGAATATVHAINNTDLTVSSTLASYAMAVSSNLDSNRTQGIGFRHSSSLGSTPGAAIVFTRNGSQSVGDLHFQTRTGTGTSDPVATRWSILQGGNLQAATGMKIVNLTDPTSNQDAATKKYVDDADALAVHLAGNETITGQKRFTAAIKIANDVSLTLENVGDTNNNSFKTGTDGTFLVDIGSGNSVKIKGGDNAGAESLGYTDDSFNNVWSVNTLGNSTQNGKATAAAFAVGGFDGADGSFTTVDGKTVTVTKGLITAIV